MSNNKRNILLTGGCGFIGSNLVRWLLGNTPHHVYNADALTYAGNRDSLADIEDHSRYKFAHVDVTDKAAVERAFAESQPDYVMHLAAESHVDRSIDGPGTFIHTNINGTFVLLQAARKYFASLDSERRSRFRFLHVSTDEVYGSLGESGYFTEDTPYDPHSPYSASKAAADHLARAWHATYNLPVLITNCSNNYGPFQFPEKLIPVVILKAIHGEPIPVYGTGANVRDWLYVLDLAEALYKVVTCGRIGETYNIGGNNELRNVDLVRLLCEILDEVKPKSGSGTYASQITFVKDRPGHDLRYAIDASKIQRELGWRPSKDRDSGLRETVCWYLENEGWWTRILDGSYCMERLGDAGIVNRP